MIFAIALLALGLRLYGLGSESIWLDEATSIWLAKMDLPSLVEWTAVDIHPPFYYALLHYWLALGDGEVQVRLLSVLIGVTSVILLYVLARRVYDPDTGTAAALLLAASPLHVWYCQETRMYALLTLLALLSSYFMIRALLDRKGEAWVGYLVCGALALYTHYYGFFILLFQGVLAVYLLWQGIVQRRVVLRWFALQGVVLVLFLPWLPVLMRQVQAGGGGWVARVGAPDVSGLVAAAVSFTLGPDLRWYPALLRRAAYIAFGALILAALVSDGPRRSAKERFGAVFCLVYLALPLGAAWLVSQLKPLYSLRYLLPFLPPYYILVARGLGILKNRWVWLLVLGALVAVGLVGIVGSATHAQQPDWRGLTSYVLVNGTPADVVVFVPGWNSKPFEYYARGRVSLVADTPIPIESEDVPALVAGAAHGHARLWLVWAEGHYADPQGLVRGYLDRTYPVLDSRRFRDNVTLSLYDVGSP